MDKIYLYPPRYHHDKYDIDQITGFFSLELIKRFDLRVIYKGYFVFIRLDFKLVGVGSKIIEPKISTMFHRRCNLTKIQFV